jgi:carbamoyl-phosphate synthase large subunit
MPTALVLDGGSSPAVTFVRSLGRGGWRVLAQQDTRAANSRFVAAAVPIPAATESPEGFAAAVAQVCQTQQVDIVVPCTDAESEVLWQAPEKLAGAVIVGGDRLSVERFLDKGETLAASDSVGFPTPEWRSPTTFDELVVAAGEIGYPCALKARRTYARVESKLIQRRYLVVRNAAEARRSADLLALDGVLPIVEAFVPGRSLAVTAVISGGKILAGVAREALTFFPITGGASCWRRTVAPDDTGVADAFLMLQKLDYDGLAEVEYQVDADGIPRLMEIGVRAHGWVSLAVAAGVDIPLIAARAALGQEPPPAEPVSWQVGVEMRSPGSELSRVRQALDFRKPMPTMYSRRGVLSTLWPPWRPGMRYDHVDLGDLGPWLPAPLARRRAAPSLELDPTTRLPLRTPQPAPDGDALHSDAA